MEDGVMGMLLPAEPAGGGYLVLNRAQWTNEALMQAIREAYPRTQLIEQGPIPVAQWTRFG